jgi:hypothetical protein
MTDVEERAAAGEHAGAHRELGWVLGLRVQICDEPAAAAVPAAAIVEYLTRRGWQHRQRLDTASLWSHPQLPGRLLVVPGAPQAADYGRQVLHLVADLAEAEQRSQLGVFADLLATG